MKLGSIRFKDFRVYRGEQHIDFTAGVSGNNIHLIAGKNGYGKTSFLTSLIWGLYGKHMVHVEEQYKKDIRNSGGYNAYREGLFNNSAKDEYNAVKSLDSQFFVELEFVDVFIPSLPCKSILIRREFDLALSKEKLQILIDGDENELTKEVGFETFINDYILPRDIAKFFFFDAEKIVSLAEAKSIEELKALSKAYSEVLGIKKYEDLKKSLKSLMVKLKRKGATGEQREVFDNLLTSSKELQEKIHKRENQLEELEEQIDRLKLKEASLQEMLIREGNSITLEALIELKEEAKSADLELKKTKNKLKGMFNVLPFLIARNSFEKLVDQIKLEHKIKDDLGSKQVLNDTLITIKTELSQFLGDASVDKGLSEGLLDIISSKMTAQNEVTGEVLLNFDHQKASSITSLYDYVITDFQKELGELRELEKRQKHTFFKVNRKISEAEARKDNPNVLTVRKERDEVIEELERKSIAKGALLEELIELNRLHSNAQKQISEKEKNLKVIKQDIEKYKTTDHLLAKVSSLITRIKEQKKISLENSLKQGLGELMHKDFVSGAQVSISEEVLDIELIDKFDRKIRKETLSKGEQQLYASALLKALVAESGIDFPVFIDSPMQKFDKYHSESIIRKFYPSISKQVVLFPLLEKELTRSEFEQLKPSLKSTFFISHNTQGSHLNEVSIDDLFKSLNDNYEYTLQDK